MKNTKAVLARLIAILGVMLIALTGCVNSDDEIKEENTSKSEGNNQEEQQVQTESIVNNGGSFVEYNDEVYFWRISDSSREDNALFANYSDNGNAKNSLVKIDENGVEQQIYSGSGSGEIFIKNKKIFLSEPVTNSNGVIDGSRKIYSIDLNGANKVEYQTGDLKGIVGEYIIFENNSSIYRINSEDGKIESLKENANFLSVVDDNIYYTASDTTSKLSIGSIEGKTDNGIIASISKNDFSNISEDDTLEVVDFWYENNMINFYVGYRAGTAHMLQEEILVKMDKNGENLTKDNDIAFEENGADEESEQVSEGVYKRASMSNGDYEYSYVYVDPTTLEHIEFITEDELNSKFGLKTGDEYLTTIYTSSVVDDSIYVVIDNNEHYSENDIGWRYAYKRIKTVCFKYDINTKTITEIYNF